MPNLASIFKSGQAPSLTSSITNILNLNLTGANGGDYVRIVDTVLNTGPGAAYNIGVQDNLPSGTLLNTTTGLNNSGVTGIEVVRGDGVVLASTNLAPGSWGATSPPAPAPR